MYNNNNLFRKGKRIIASGIYILWGVILKIFYIPGSQGYVTVKKLFVKFDKWILFSEKKHVAIRLIFDFRGSKVIPYGLLRLIKIN